MRTRIRVGPGLEYGRVTQLVNCYQALVESSVDQLQVSVEKVAGRGGDELYRCQVVARLNRQPVEEVVETQSDLALAVNRALARTVRALSRQQPMPPLSGSFLT
jgi:hypothetical protein